MAKSGKEERNIKMKKTKEEIQLRQAKKKAVVEDICYVLVIMFFLIMLAVAIYILYLMLTYKW